MKNLGLLLASLISLQATVAFAFNGVCILDQPSQGESLTLSFSDNGGQTTTVSLGYSSPQSEIGDEKLTVTVGTSPSNRKLISLSANNFDLTIDRSQPTGPVGG